MVANPVYKYFPPVAVLVVILLFVFSPKASLDVCNASPYTTDHIAFANIDGELTALSGRTSLAPGTCITAKKRFWFGSPEFFVHTSIPSQSQFTYSLVRDIKNADTHDGGDGVSNPLEADEVQYWGVAHTCFPTPTPIEKREFFSPDHCPISFYLAGLQPAFSMKSRKSWNFVWEHPDLALLKSSGDFESDLEQGLASAKRLERSIGRQTFYEREWRGKAPFIAGGRMEDQNGPLNPGVWLFEMPQKNVFGEPQLLRSGDAILKVNGSEVFGQADLAQLLINHGLSRDHGIETLVRYEILRGTQKLVIEAPYYFNVRYHAHAGDQSGLAFWYGVGDAVSFGQTPWALCYGNNALRGAANGVSKLWEFGRSQIKGEKYNKRNEAGIEYIDAAECKWQKEQARGLARQKELDTYVNSQWFAIVTPSAVRLIGKKAVKNSFVKSGMKKAAGARLADTVLEAGESALWSLGTAPPGTPLAKRVKDTATLAGIGAAGGYLSSSLFGNAKAISKKRGK